MATVKEIKNRIKGVRDTKKITSAMYLIASTKMRRAKSDLDKTRPYFKALEQEITRVFSKADVNNSEFFYSDKDEFEYDDPCVILSITADKGLAGAYNNNIIELTDDLLARHKNSRLYVVGEYGRQYYNRKNIPYEYEFLYTSASPTIDIARQICDKILEHYNDKENSRVMIVYTDMKNGMSQEARVKQLLPVHVSKFEGKKVDNCEFEYIGGALSVLDGLVPDYIAGYVYSSLVDSFCSEQNARMQAMNSANQNADNILGELQIQYNRVRQAMITQEITEVSAGAKAQKNKKKRRQA